MGLSERRSPSCTPGVTRDVTGRKSKPSGELNLEGKPYAGAGHASEGSTNANLLIILTDDHRKKEFRKYCFTPFFLLSRRLYNQLKRALMPKKRELEQNRLGGLNLWLLNVLCKTRKIKTT